MSYTDKLVSLLKNHQERFPGQHQEITEMTNAHGCDINEHVPTLIEYGRKVKNITEMGVRFGWSTRSFLFTEPKTLHSIDKFEWNSIHQAGCVQSPGNSMYKKYHQLYEGIVDFTYEFGNTMDIPPIQETDLLFIDTFHHRDCLSKELALHGNQARKYIIFHDTTTFGERGQNDSSLCFVNFKATDEIGTGLKAAIKPWLKANPHWTVREEYQNNNGLTILERN